MRLQCPYALQPFRHLCDAGLPPVVQLASWCTDYVLRHHLFQCVQAISGLQTSMATLQSIPDRHSDPSVRLRKYQDASVPVSKKKFP